MNKIANQIFYLSLLLFFCITIKANRKPHTLSKNGQQLDVLRNSIHTSRESVEKSKNLAKFSIKDRLKKLSNPKSLFKVSTFFVGMTTGLMTGGTAHLLGQQTVWKHLYPKNLPKNSINLHEEANHLKVALGCASGPIISFLGSCGLLKFLTKYNATESTYSPLLSGLKFGSKINCLNNILCFMMIHPGTNGQHILQALKKNNFPPPNSKWYHYLVDASIGLALAAKFLKPDFVRHCSHLFS